MTLDEKIAQVEKVINLLLKIEAHAMFMIVVGALMCLHGQAEDGKLIIGAGLAVFKGKA